MRSFLAASFIFLSSALFAQIHFSIPKHENGRPIANEKFEMLEKSWERYNYILEHGKVNPSSPQARVSTRGASGETQVGEAGYFESEIHAAVNPLDPDNIAVGVMRFDPFNFLESVKFSIYVTKDLGDSWTKSSFEGMHPTRIPLGGGDPMFAFDDKGVLFFSWLRLDSEIIPTDLDWGMYVAKSEDGGLTWEELEKPIEFSKATDLEFLSDLEVASDKQWMSSDLSETSPHKGNVYISYININPNTGEYSITFKRKLAGEENFGSELGDEGIVIQSAVGRILQFANIEVDNDGNIFIIYLADIDDRDHVYTMYLSKSVDGGKTFTPGKVVTEMSYPDFASGWRNVPGISDDRTYPCPQLGLDRSGGAYDGRIYTTFTAYGIDTVESAGLDIYLSFSDDQGDTWSTPQIVNDDLDVEKHQFYSSITVNDKGEPIVAWYDRRSDVTNSGYTEYYLGFSEDGGESFEQFPVSEEASDFVALLENNGDFGIGEYNEVVTSGEYMIPFWADGRAGGDDIVVYAYFFNPNSSNTLEKQVLLSDKISLTSLSPNPASDHFNFDLSLKSQSDLRISMYNVDGKVVKVVSDAKQKAGHLSFKVDVADLHSGIYYLTVESDFGNITRKVFKNKT